MVAPQSQKRKRTDDVAPYATAAGTGNTTAKMQDTSTSSNKRKRSADAGSTNEQCTKPKHSKKVKKTT
eukprot:3079-Heterococcus_DN1.PRE.2